jgi:hypothetical protein
MKPEHRCTRILGRFARLPRAEVVRLARIAGLTSARSGRAHKWTVDTARDAGRKGGLATAAARKLRR